MEIESTQMPALQIKFFIQEGGGEIARAYLLIGHNGLHAKPFALLEDVFVAEEARGKGIGTVLVQRVIQEAKLYGCYKCIATSRFSRNTVHEWYTRIGFQQHGTEFRMDF